MLSIMLDDLPKARTAQPAILKSVSDSICSTHSLLKCVIQMQATPKLALQHYSESFCMMPDWLSNEQHQAT
jgi:hypothetical protein